MNQFLLSILFFLSSQQAMSQTLKLADLEGKWFVNLSNFPMWLKGNKTNPTFNYALKTKHGKPVLLDEVLYTKKSKTKKIVGYDKPMNETNNAFTWRGKGLLGFVKSKWNILCIDPENQWMIIHFDKTLFTPEGYDVVSRSKILDAELEKDIREKLKGLGVEKKLTDIHQD